MKIIKINLKKIDPKIIKIATRIIKNGGVVAMPFDTCYGLAADATNKDAVNKIYKIKRRPRSKPISIVIKDLKSISKYLKSRNLSARALKLLPGAYTIILPVKQSKKHKKLYTIYNNTLSVRIPNFKLTKLLSKILKKPYTATSANISNQPSAWSAKEVKKYFQNQKLQPDLILDAGKLPKKSLSTIIDLSSSQVIKR